MRVLVACEFSGVVREAFNSFHGVNAFSCDILPPEDGRVDYHLQTDVRKILNAGWDLMIAFPPCTFLCSSGLHWNKRKPGRAEKTEEALEFVKTLMDARIPRIAIENPIGCISSRIRKPDQIIQPYDFGEDASKSTCLWLSYLPPLKPTKHIPGRIVNGAERWGNQTDSGQNKLAPSETRGMERSRTYPGIAMAMAEQWIPVVMNNG